MEFDSNPFDPSSPNLRSLESGIEASRELIIDFNGAFTDGKANLDIILNERVFSKTNSLYSHVSRKERKNFSKQLVENSSGNEKGNVLQLREMESKALASVINLASESGMKLEELFMHRVTEECLPIFNVNGTFRKVQKK